MRKKHRKVLVFVNIIAPYNVPFFNRLNDLLDTQVQFFFDRTTETNRQWKIDERDVQFQFEIENSPNIRRSSTINNGTQLFRTIYLPFFVFKRIWQHKPDVVLSIEFGLRTLFSQCMCKLTGAKMIIVSDVTPNTEAHVGNIKRMLRRRLARNANGAVARSYSAKSYLKTLGFREEQITVAPYAVEQKKDTAVSEELNVLLNKIRAAKERRICFFYSGQFNHRKGIDLLAKTVGKLPADIQEKLLFVMAGGTEKELQEILPAYNKKIFLPVGFVPNNELHQLYAIADCFILPTRSDTWALVVNEAVAAGCPVMLSKYAGSADELIEDGKTGIVFDPLSEEDFVEKLLLAVNNRERLRAFSQAAKEKLNEYNYEVAAYRTLQLINQLRT